MGWKSNSEISGMCWTSNKDQSWASIEKVERNIKPSGKLGYSTAPAWKVIQGLHKIRHSLRKGKTEALTGRRKSIFLGYDRTMLKYMAGGIV